MTETKDNKNHSYYETYKKKHEKLLKNETRCDICDCVIQTRCIEQHSRSKKHILNTLAKQEDFKKIIEIETSKKEGKKAGRPKIGLDNIDVELLKQTIDILKELYGKMTT